MAEDHAHKRYPGAAPFGDDELSRRVFFGREDEVAVLADQIFANRLVVVYAKSGIGKTSFLSAGVAERLRRDGCVPLMIRVNLTTEAPVALVVSGVGDNAKRQNLEYAPGRTDSLWHFFKTTEFWRGDVLLTPVLILDQFEEIFTLHSPEFRMRFLAEVASVIRGVRPSGTAVTNDAGLTDTPPEVRVVLSLREDFLSALEEAADVLPHILAQRFRLNPLTIDAATSAICGPSVIEDRAFATVPFEVPKDTANYVLQYLSQRTTQDTRPSIRTVEPFELQLVCQRMEEIAAERQSVTGAAKVSITVDDLGGEDGIHAILGDFCRSVLQSISPWWTRRAVRKLCTDYLISPHGRRLSVEESEVKRLVRVPPETLHVLVDRRLLRSDQRADSVYYELSHDSLVAPVLAERRLQRAVTGGILWIAGALAWVGGGLGVITSAIVAVALPIRILFSDAHFFEGWSPVWDALAAGMLLGMACGLYGGLYLAGRWMFRRGRDILRQFRRRPRSLPAAAPTG